MTEVFMKIEFADIKTNKAQLAILIFITLCILKLAH